MICFKARALVQRGFFSVVVALAWLHCIIDPVCALQGSAGWHRLFFCASSNLKPGQHQMQAMILPLKGNRELFCVLNNAGTHFGKCRKLLTSVKIDQYVVKEIITKEILGNEDINIKIKLVFFFFNTKSIEKYVVTFIRYKIMLYTAARWGVICKMFSVEGFGFSGVSACTIIFGCIQQQYKKQS